MWHCWISGTVEGDENVKRDKTIDFVALFNMWDFEWNYTVESNKTSKICTLLNRWECKTR